MVEPAFGLRNPIVRELRTRARAQEEPLQAPLAVLRGLRKPIVRELRTRARAQEEPLQAPLVVVVVGGGGGGQRRHHVPCAAHVAAAVEEAVGRGRRREGALQVLVLRWPAPPLRLRRVCVSVCEPTRSPLNSIWPCGLFEGKGVSTSRVSPPGPLSISYGHVGCLKARAFPPPV
jgi:hypothetical protein